MIKRYLTTLHTRSEQHKKHFSLIVSGCFTLLIFAMWLSVRFSGTTDTSAVVTAAPVDETSQTMSPFENLRASAGDSWKMLTGGLDKAKQGLQSVDLQDSYTQVKNDALNNNQYGQ